MKIIQRFFYMMIPFLILVQPAYAWDTDIKSTYTGWRAIYNSVEIGTNPKALKHSEDEHAKLSNLALKGLGVGWIYGIGTEGIEITDLNASIFRPYTVGAQENYPRKQLKRALETRLLPPPPHFSGIPDFSYSIMDWINKNQLCPVNDGDIDASQLCHEFMGWMGALNSNHFGTQAANSYWHLHKLAVSLAARAKEMREKFSRDDVALEEYESFIREAEREALAVEGYAQHFLEDRWAVGHMWERWGSSGFGQLPSKDPLTNMEIGAFAGFLHGSESTTVAPDSLSSPNVSWGEWARPKTLDSDGYIIPGKGYNISRWSHFASKYIYDGIGDYRLEDMIDGGFGKEYVSINRGVAAADGNDYRLEVNAQKFQMMACFKAGWSEVISGFGEGPNGGFGTESAELKKNAAGNYLDFASLGKLKCDDIWATNESIKLGWFGSQVTILAKIAKSGLEFSQDAAPVITNYFLGKLAKKALGTDPKNARKFIKINRQAWLNVSYNIWAQAKLAKNSAGLAKGAIGSAGIFKTGEHYAELAEYVEPVDLDELPYKDDKNGMDIQAWYGFFNKSHSDYWCEYQTVIELTRGTKHPKGIQACVYMADRLYEGTDPNYKGENQEARRTSGVKHGQKFGAVCSLLSEKPESYNEDIPAFLHPGYVGKPYAKNKQKKMQSIENWCKQIPVINYIPDNSGEIQDDWVAKFEEWDKEITITGHNFGDKRGTLTSCLLDNEVLEIKSWNDQSISFMPPVKGKEHAKDGDVFSLCMKREDTIKSVGSFNFVYHAKPVKIEQIQVKDDDGVYFDKQAGFSKVIPYGKMLYIITFAEKMDTDSLKTEIKVGDQFIKGFWRTPDGKSSSDTVWRGWYNSPEEINDENRFDTRLGKHFEGEQVLQINARSENGGGVDPGDDPIPFKPKGDATDEFMKLSYKSPNREYSLSFGKKEATEIAGKVTASDGSIVSGATISVAVAEKKYTAISGQDGSYQITIPKDVVVLNILTLKAEKKETDGGSEIVRKKDFQKADIVISLSPVISTPYAKSGCWGSRMILRGTRTFSLSNSSENGYVSGLWKPITVRGESIFIPIKAKIKKDGIEIDLKLAGEELEKSRLMEPFLANQLYEGVTEGRVRYDRYLTVHFDLKFSNKKVDVTRQASYTKTDLTGTRTDQTFYRYREYGIRGDRWGEIGRGEESDEKVISQVTIPQWFSSVKSIQFTSPDFSTPVTEVNSGNRIWLKAKGKNLCPGAMGQMLVKLLIPSKNTPRYMAIVLSETPEDNGEFRSAADGIQIDDDPGKAITNIGVIPVAANMEEIGSLEPIINIPFSRHGQQATTSFGDNPFNPKVGYRALQDYTFTSSGKELINKVIIYYDPKGKVRRKFLKFSSATIQRFDLGIGWQLFDNAKGYQEGVLREAADNSKNIHIISKNEIKREKVNGIPATKYKMTSESPLGSASGIYWISDDGIIVKYKQSFKGKNGKIEKTSLEIKELTVGKQDPSLFEIPEGYKLGRMR